MAEGVLFNIVEEILKNMGSRALSELASAWGFKSQIEKLKNTINTIKDVLLDAEERQLQSHAIRGWFERLKVVVYTADDLFDKLATMVSQKEVMGGSKFTKEVKTFFSPSNQIANAFSISNKIKTIREKLDEIVKDGSEFAFVLRPCEDQRVTYRLGRETHSFIDAQEVIGRDDDMKAILEILGQYRDQQVCVIPIVGIGGMGKTTLAQIVYNEVEKNFDLSLWVCVSDNFDIKEIVIKILKSATDTKPQNLELDQLQKKLRLELTGKKYLLVLDDVWNEDAEKWRQLCVLLKVGREGSKVLVTSRSMQVANIMKTIPYPYHLKGLSEEKSLALFTKTAFAPEQEDKDPELLSIGEKIVKNCANVPLAIRTLGSLLCGREKCVWVNMKDRSLVEIAENGNHIMAILEISYHHLMSRFKNCFAYCALFPKDYNFRKKELISLWIAQGFVIPTHESQSLEDAGEEYFLTLLHRCFFQDVERDEWGNIESCKMHDLMHDLALKVTGLDCKRAELEEMDFDDRVHHLSIGYSSTASREIPSTMLNLKLLRTFLLLEQEWHISTFSESQCHRLLSSYESLRVLGLSDFPVTSLPSSIGNLIHLRYINLSWTRIKALPNSITELRNLQTLILTGCDKLRKLPNDLRKLVNLRILDVWFCGLTQMPSGLGALTSLHTLSFFVVNCNNSRAFMWKSSTAQLRDLKNLNNLKDSLEVRIRGDQKLKDPTYEAREANLSSKHALMNLYIQWEDFSHVEISDIKHDEAILEGLQPHCNLKKLEIKGYKGEKFPSWAVEDNLCTTLPNLVEVILQNLVRCQHLPSFSQLPFLKRLILHHLNNVEYIESSVPVIGSLSKEALFFPSLEELKLEYMYKLKGWWREVEEVVGDDEASSSIGVTNLQQHQSGKSFPNVFSLSIISCGLKSMPHCPKLGNLTLIEVDETHKVLLEMAASSAISVASSSTSSSKLKSLEIDDVEALISLPNECLSHLTTLKIMNSKWLNEYRLKELFKNLNSLSCLEFESCDNLRSINCGLEHLTALEKLELYDCKDLDLSPNQDGDDSMPWIALKNLRDLELRLLDKVVALPKGLQHLTNLRSILLVSLPLVELPEWIGCFSSLVRICIFECSKLTCVPEGLHKLTKLNQLRIIKCPGLTKRCQGPSGEDWPKINHIPFLNVSEDD